MITSQIKIKVEECDRLEGDTWESWVWTLLDEYGGVICDGYSGSEVEAWADARERRKEEIEYLNSEG